ncbi:flagellar motor switch protein FliM [Sphingomonas sp. Leaf343]|uniref:flagellar motor switch protein FliM n=1 Tax=Sphingomonas sp. Leaf343 TaxID=1736345 RepID=UPI00070197E7|nr:flagellar motor switch protein FliM [Sphingomonas sp. Leaf343]KQR82237.1 flagellar motor switch protein FliM [Sphingomonas sp. Leaf343]
MVNAPPTSDRRTREREPARETVLGAAKLNPFGDLNTLQHLSARLARTLRPVWEQLLRQEIRCWAEPLSVQRFGDYRVERGDTLTAWAPLGMTPSAGANGGKAWCVIEGRFVLEMLDLFFGGSGAVMQPLPTEFSPAADAMAQRIARAVTTPLAAAWEPLTRVSFQAERAETNADIDHDDAVIVTRFGIAAGEAQPQFVDILYPVAALKPHGATLTGKVLDKAEPDPVWRNNLTRATMGVRFPVRSVLAEPVVALTKLMDLKPGDVIPISINADVPVMVGRDRLGCGTVGTSNGRAAIRLTSLAFPEGFDQ